MGICEVRAGSLGLYSAWPRKPPVTETAWALWETQSAFSLSLWWKIFLLWSDYLLSDFICYFLFFHLASQCLWTWKSWRLCRQQIADVRAEQSLLIAVRCTGRCNNLHWCLFLQGERLHWWWKEAILFLKMTNYAQYEIRTVSYPSVTDLKYLDRICMIGMVLPQRIVLAKMLTKQKPI